MMFDISKVPFSRYGSYFSLSINDWGPLGTGLYLRAHYGKSPMVFRIDPVRDGQVLAYDTEASPSLLKLTAAGGGDVEFVISGDGTARLRGRGVSLRLEMPAERWTWAYQIPGAWAFNYSPCQFQLALDMLRGDLDVVAPWRKGKGFCYETTHAVMTLSGDAEGCFEAAIDDFLTTWIKPERATFDTCREAVAREYAEWTRGLPEVGGGDAAACDLAAYVNWSAVVNPAGYVTRPAMYMSKMGMCNVYNWDNVFNAMAHCAHRPGLAWDQLLIMADHQDTYGKSPSSMNRNEIRMTITNSPIHGWGLRYMRAANPGLLTPERRAEAYDYLSRWTEWIRTCRVWPGDRLPFHHHGFDGGWDNASIFDQGVPVITPDYAAYTILQMEVLSDLAKELGRAEEAVVWNRRAEDMLTALVEDLWRDDRFIGILRPSGKAVFCDSLLICMPLVLGTRLPEDVRTHLVARVKDHLTPHGLATEKLDSPAYVEGGYWRGPIWAPSTMLITSGLIEIGEAELARTIMRAFCDMCAENGFYENFDPITGKGYYDTAYTWTSSVFMMFARMLHGNSPTSGEEG
ncbi:MAG: hypothetical protein RRC34_11275 [Lentisphaeria bacterium]|nr:hypothetical protein [Lentisphaeria bacterium]